MGSDRSPERPSGLLAVVALVLSTIGFANSVYLTNLYVEATKALSDGTNVDSFCNISEGINCETVAASEYSSFLGVPIAVYGLEFFGLAIALVVASHFKLIRIMRWDSLLFALSALGVPVTIVLGWISASVIRSVCIMCLIVYAVNGLMVAILAIPNRTRLATFFLEGPRELLTYATNANHRVTTVIAVLLALSQFYWVPRVMGRDAHAANPSEQAEIANATPGKWLDLPASRNTLGPVNAPIRIEEFTDFQCPFCGRAHQVMLEAVKKYPGKIHLIHRDFPLDNNCNSSIQERFHPDACEAAFFARCAADQDLYWPFESVLFRNQSKLKSASMMSFAKEVGLDTDKLRNCVRAKNTREAVLADIEEGLKRDVSGTPTLFANGETIVGARPIEFWDQKIQELLAIAPAASASLSPPASGSAAPTSSQKAPPVTSDSAPAPAPAPAPTATRSKSAD